MLLVNESLHRMQISVPEMIQVLLQTLIALLLAHVLHQQNVNTPVM